MHCSSQITSNSTLLLCPVVNGIADNTHALPVWIVLLFPQCLWTKPVSWQLPWPCRYYPYLSVCEAGATVCLCLVAFTHVGISKLKCQRERNFCNSGESTSEKAVPVWLWTTTIWEKTIIARDFLMHGEKAHEMKGRYLESFLYISPARSGYSFRLWHTCILKRDSRRVTLSKAVQDQSEDKPLPVVLMLTQG